MATTLIRKEIHGVPVNLMIKSFTVQDEEGNDVSFLETCTVDDNLKPLTQPSRYEIDYDPADAHKDLRRQAAEKGQLITSHSTDPEWNPEGYTKNLEDA